MDRETATRRVERLLRTILQDKGLERDAFAPDESLYEDGIGLDSLDAATFSVMLEQDFGTDPYSADQFPQTLADVVAFYTDGRIGQ
ncbi:MAG: acyl carrier protein [Chloroflexi bacterium]|nr:acyl carrier protein [Chloroflexota bacterium]